MFAVTLGINNLLLFQRLMSVDDVLELVVCCQIGLVFNKHFSLLEYGYFGPEILKFVAKKTPISVYETFWKGRGWTIEGGISKCFTEWKWLKSSHRENNIYVIMSWRHQLTVEDPLGQSHHTRLITSWWTPHKGFYLLDIVLLSLYYIYLICSSLSIVQTL